MCFYNSLVNIYNIKKKMIREHLIRAITRIKKRAVSLDRHFLPVEKRQK